jgi:hypothetical protein
MRPNTGAGGLKLKTLKGVLVALILLLGGCREIPHPLPPLVIPDVKDIWRISINRRTPSGEWQSEHEIVDPRKMEAILAELRVDNTGYSSEMYGRSPQEYSIGMSGHETMEAMIWVGHGWLGGVDRHHEDLDGGLSSHFRKLKPEQHIRLLLLMKQPPEEP